MNVINKPTLFRKSSLLLMATTIILAGCSGGADDDLLEYIDEVKTRPGGRIEALPQIKPYENFVYQAANLRSPFVPDRPDVQNPTGPKPIEARNKEYLEQFPLDALDMVGALISKGETYGLVRSQDGLVHRVKTGNYLGQKDGQITAITDSEIQISELIPDGIGGFYQRTAAIALSD
jgi:type IV pilus assembly protein PilP